jgi:hypothetical protein
MGARSTTQWTPCQRFRKQQNQGFELGCWLHNLWLSKALHEQVQSLWLDFLLPFAANLAANLLTYLWIARMHIAEQAIHRRGGVPFGLIKHVRVHILRQANIGMSSDFHRNTWRNTLRR